MEYPIKIGKLKQFRGVFKDVTIELTKEGNFYYILLYDTYKGLICKARINKLDAYYLFMQVMCKAGYSRNAVFSEEKFFELTRKLDFQFLDR